MIPSRCDWLHKNLLEVVNATGMVAFTLARDEIPGYLYYCMRSNMCYDIIKNHLQTEDEDEEEKRKCKERTRRD